MQTDRYTKIVLTIIAGALVAIAVQNSISPSVAAMSITGRVAICNTDDFGNINCARVNSDGQILTTK